MGESVVDLKRRRFLTRSTTVVGAIGTAFVAVPFIKSWNPSAKAKAAGSPVEVDISKLEEGSIVVAAWRGKPVYVIKRTAKNLTDLGLSKVTDKLLDPESEKSKQPEYAKNSNRARDNDSSIFVVEAVCTHLGCAPKHRPEVAPADLGDSWIGGFFCPCHGSKFDLAGRVFSGYPAPSNLPVPDYVFLSKTKILIGGESS